MSDESDENPYAGAFVVLTDDLEGAVFWGTRAPKGGAWAHEGGRRWVRRLTEAERAFLNAGEVAQRNALLLAAAHGHDWACRADSTDGAETLRAWLQYEATYTGPLWTGIGPSVDHTTGTGRLRWQCAKHIVQLDVFRPPLAEGLEPRRVLCLLLWLEPVEGSDPAVVAGIQDLVVGQVFERHLQAVETCLKGLYDTKPEIVARTLRTLEREAVCEAYVADAWRTFCEHTLSASDTDGLPTHRHLDALSKGLVRFSQLAAFAMQVREH